MVRSNFGSPRPICSANTMSLMRSESMRMNFRARSSASSDPSLIQLLGTATLFANLLQLLVSGVVPPGAAGFSMRWGAAAMSAIFIASRLRHLLRPLMIFLPYILAGLLITPFGFDPAASSVRLVQMSLCLMAGLLLGYTFEHRMIFVYIKLALLFCLALSISLVFLSPDIGLQPYGTKTVWKGTLVGKNQLGWVSSDRKSVV